MGRIWAYPCAALALTAPMACANAAAPDPAGDARCVAPIDRAPARGECTLVDWDVVEVSADSITIEYLANDPGCSLDLDRVEVDETAASVTLRVLVGYGGDDGATCPTSIAGRTTLVALADPLGARQLLGCRPEGSFAPAGGYDSPEPRDPAIDCSPGGTT